LALAKEFKQYQNDKIIGDNLQKLSDYHQIVRYKELQNLVINYNEGIEGLNKKLEDYKYRLNNFNELKICKHEYDSCSYGMDPNLTKREYTRSFGRLEETEKYYWYEDMKNEYSISFEIHLRCVRCDNH